MTKKLIVFLCALISIIMPATKVAFADETPLVNEQFLTITKIRSNESSGSIYFATIYTFNTFKKYDCVIGGNSVSLGYNEIITNYKQKLDELNIDYIFDENLPFTITVIDRKYNSHTEFDHENGITGDELYDPPQKGDSDFWYTSYVSTNSSYLADGGKKAMIDELKVLATLVLGVTNPTINESELKFNYCYGTQLKTITSSADRVVEIKPDKMYYHFFDNLTEDTQITLIQKVQNVQNWYGLIVGLSLAFVLIGVVAFIVIKKRRKNE